MAPRRTLLDPLLAAAAADAGAEVRYGAAVRGASLRDRRGRVTGVAVCAPPPGRPRSRAGLVIGADGRRSRVARAVGAEVTLAGRHACAAVYAYVAGLDDRGYRWHYGTGATAGAIPTNGGLHVIFVGMPPARLPRRRRARPDRAIRTVLAEVHPGLAEEVRRRAS